MHNGVELGAVDLGSNSFCLELARLDHGQLARSGSLKETVRLDNGLDADGRLRADAMQRGWACLERFAARLAGLPPAQMRAVATQTLRAARNRDVFLARAQQILGVPIEVISGQEEARLIYQGTALVLPPSNERRLVVDIGGGSTELILGQGDAVDALDSCPVGSVSLSRQWFAAGRYTRETLDAAEAAVRDLLQGALAPAARWDTAYGVAGTAETIAGLLQAAGRPAAQITRPDLDWLRQQLLQAGHADALQLAGLRDEHRAVLGGGLCMMRAVFARFGLTTLQVIPGGVGLGLLRERLLAQGAPTGHGAAPLAPP